MKKTMKMNNETLNKLMHRLSDYIKEIKNKVTDEETHSQTFEIFQYLYQWHNEIIEILCTRWVCTLKQKMRRHF